MEIQAPTNVAGKVPGDYTVSYTYTGAKPEALTGTVVTPSESNKFGCEAFSAEDAAKIKDKWGVPRMGQRRRFTPLRF